MKKNFVTKQADNLGRLKQADNLGRLKVLQYWFIYFLGQSVSFSAELDDC